MMCSSFASGFRATLLLGISFALCVSAPLREIRAADNELTPVEASAGWKLLFNGRDLAGWKNNDAGPVAAKIEEGAINVHGTGGYLLVYDQPLADFVLKCDVKMSAPECNSGVFVRTSDLADPVQSGLEVQIYDGPLSDVQGFAAIYDLVAASRDARHGPGQWDTLEIRCDGPKISVKVNGQEVSTLNCDEWDQPGRRLDGTPHKFNRAIKDFARRGYVGLQDHGHDVWFKNIKLLEL